MYIAPGWGHMSPWGPFFLESLIFSPTAHFLQDFHFKGAHLMPPGERFITWDLPVDILVGVA